MKTVEISEAKGPLSQYARRAQRETLVLTEDGKPVAAVVPIEEMDLESLSLGHQPRLPGPCRAVPRPLPSWSRGPYRRDAKEPSRTSTAGAIETSTPSTKIKNERSQREASSVEINRTISSNRSGGVPPVKRNTRESSAMR